MPRRRACRGRARLQNDWEELCFSCKRQPTIERRFRDDEFTLGPWVRTRVREGARSDSACDANPGWAPSRATPAPFGDVGPYAAGQPGLGREPLGDGIRRSPGKGADCCCAGATRRPSGRARTSRCKAPRIQDVRRRVDRTPGGDVECQRCRTRKRRGVNPRPGCPRLAPGSTAARRPRRRRPLRTTVTRWGEFEGRPPATAR